MLLKSSKRGVIDSQLVKDLPALEFKRFVPDLHATKVVPPHLMAWSGIDQGKPLTLETEQKMFEQY